MDQNVKKQTKTDFTLKNGLWREKRIIWESCLLYWILKHFMCKKTLLEVILRKKIFKVCIYMEFTLINKLKLKTITKLRKEKKLLVVMETEPLT